MNSKTAWKYLFLIFPFIKPAIISELQMYSMIDNIYDIWKLIAFFCLIFLFLSRKKINLFVLSIFIYFGYIFLITFIRQGNCLNMLIQEGSMLAVCLLVFVSSEKGELKYLLNAATSLLAVFLVVNSLTVFIYEPRGGMYISDIYLGNIKSNNYFLGYDNTHINFIIPYFALSLLHDIKCYGHIRYKTFIIHIIINIAAFICSSATTLAGIVIFYLLVFFREKRYFAKLINSYVICLGHILILYLLIGLRIYHRLSYLIEGIFHKNLSVARERIWQLYLNAFLRHSLLGHGYLTSTGRVAKAGVVHAHNMYLDVLFEAGIIGFFLYMLVIFLATNAGKKIVYKEQKIVIIAIIAYMIVFQAEAFRYCPTFFLLLSFSYEIGRGDFCVAKK